MPVTAATHPLLSDHLKRLDPNGKIAAIVELMSQTNEILQDAVYVEGNLPTGHRTTIRTGIPLATWRRLNFGVNPAKSRTQQITEAIGMLETYAEVDKDLADLNGNTSEFRLSEDLAFLEGMNQQFATTLFYGDTVNNPEQFLGLAPRYAALGDPSTIGTSYGNHVIGAGNAGGTSMWLIVWGPSTVHMLYPKGSKGGLSHRDLGEVTLLDAAGGQLQGYRTHYQMKTGLCIRDWRYVVRIANINPAALTANFYQLMIRAKNTIPNLGMGRAALYCNRTLKTWLDIEAAAKANVNLTISDYAGQEVTKFHGIPIRQCDAILNTEAQLF